MNKNKKAFTLVELIVVITILAILGTIAFISLQGYSKNARDSTVISDVSLITTSLELFNIDSGKYPEPDGPTFQVTQSTAPIFTQGFIGDGVTSNLGRLNKKPLQPLTNKEYIYSKTTYGNVFEIGSELELGEGISMLDSTYAANRDDLYNYIKGTYNGVTAFTQTGGIKYVVALPSIITNTGVTMPYIDTFNKLLISGLKKSEGLEYTPTVVWTGQDFPKDATELETMMNKIVVAYTGTKVSDKGLISTILENKDEISFFNIGKDLINTSMGGKLELPTIVSRNCNLDGGLSKQDWVNGAWGECYREYCYAGFIESGIKDCTWTGDLNLQADTFISEKEPNFNVRNTGGTNVYYQGGQKVIFTSGLIPIDITKSYKLSGDFRSTGLNPNKMLFGLVSYDENKKIINVEKILRKGNEATISSYDLSKIITDTTLIGWYGLGTAAHQTSIGFYYNGDTNKLPDDVMLRHRDYSTDPLIGAYSQTSGKEILLNREIPEGISSKIIPGVTKVMNHYSGNTYLYTYFNYDMQANWVTTISGNITGESFGGGVTYFRKGTKYVKLLLLTNRYSNAGSEYEMEFNNIHFQKLN